MIQKPEKISSKKKRYLWIFGISFLCIIMLSSSLYFCFPLIIKKLIPIVARSKGYDVTLHEIHTRYGSITFKKIGINSQEITGKISDISFEYTFWPLSIKEIKINNPVLKIDLGTSTVGDFEFNKQIQNLMKKVSISNGDIELKAISFITSLKTFSISKNEYPSSGLSCLLSMVTPEIKAEGDLKGLLDWDSSQFHLMSTGEIKVNKFNSNFPYNFETVANIRSQMKSLNIKADFTLYDLCSTFLTFSEEKTPNTPVGNDRQNCTAQLSSSIKYTLNKGVKASGKLALTGIPLSSFSEVSDIQCTWQMVASADLQNGYIDTYLSFSELPASIKISWPGRNNEAWEAFALISEIDYDFSDPQVYLLGSGDIIANALIKPDSWQFSADLDIKDLSWTKDENNAFEEISSKVEFFAHGDNSLKSVVWIGNLKLDRGQVLVYPWFLDLSQIPINIKAKGTLDKKKLLFNKISVFGPFELIAKEICFDKIDADIIRLSLRQIPQIQALKAKGSLDTIYEIFIQEPFSLNFNFLNNLKPRGTWLLEIDDGCLHTKIDTDLSFLNHDIIQGISLDLSYPMNKDICYSGLVEWDKLTWSQLVLGKINIPLRVCKHDLICGPIKIPVGQGEISLHKASWNWRVSSFELNKLKATNIDLKALLPDLPFSVNLYADLNQGVWNDPRLDFNGEILVNSAGGEIKFQNIWIEPLAPTPRLGADVVFEGLNLERLSDAARFGRITGKLKGQIHHLIVSGTQPESFELVMVSEPGYTGTKKISLEAVENISILGGGGSIPWLGKIFKEFPYRRIGISCSLKNDLFTLHGLIKKDGQEYIVEKGFIRGVDVINKNPDGRISFKDMLNRLKRIRRTEQD